MLDRSGTTLAYRTIVNARTGAILARHEPDRQLLDRAASSTPTRCRRSRSTASVRRRRTGPATPARPVHGRPRRPGAVRLRGRDDQDQRRRLQALLRREHDAADHGRHAVLAGAVPLLAGRRRAARRLLRPGLRLRRTAPPGRLRGRTPARSRSTTARLRRPTGRAGRPSRPPRRSSPTDMYPWGNPSTDTRKTLVLALGGRLRHRGRATSPRASRGTTTRGRTRRPSRRAATTTRPRPSWDNASAPSRAAVHAGRATRPATTRSRGRTTGTTGSASGPRRRRPAPSTTTPRRP